MSITMKNNMRKIKFRGFNKAKNEWVYGSFVNGKHASYIVDAPVQEGIPTQMIEVEHVGQFTGLFDKNNVPIFEGDVVKYQANRAEVTDVVVYISSFFGVEKFTGMLSSFYPIEVIGNIYQSPELLKK